MANGHGQNEEADRQIIPIGPTQRGRTEVRRISWPDAFKSIKLEAPGPGVGGDGGAGGSNGTFYASLTATRAWGQEAFAGGAST